MALEEKRAWIMLLAAIGGYAAYLAAVLSGARDAPLADAPYVTAMLWAIGASVVASIVANIAVAIFAPKDARRTDQRDREIGRFGEYTGQSFLVIGALAALGMSVLQLSHFWIANVLYLAFVLSATLGSVAKICAYRWGFPGW